MQLLTRIDPTIDFKWGAGSPGSPVPVDGFMVVWTGQIEPAFTETYTFYSVADDGIRVWVNTVTGNALIDNWVTQTATQRSATIALTAGQKYNIRVEYFESSNDALVQLQWESNSQRRQVIPQSRLYPTPNGQIPLVPPGLRGIVPLSKARLEEIAIAEGIVTSTVGIQNQRWIGDAFERFVAGQMGLVANGQNFLSLRREALTGGSKTQVRPDMVAGVNIIDPSTGDIINTYPASDFYEVKATRCTNFTLAYYGYQPAGEIDVAALSPLDLASIPGTPPLLTFIFTSDMVIDASVINEANAPPGGGLGVSIWHAYVFEIQGTSPPLLFVGLLMPLNAANVSISNLIWHGHVFMIPERLTRYSPPGAVPTATPAPPTDPDEDEGIDTCVP
jgi:PA14 domain